MSCVRLYFSSPQVEESSHGPHQLHRRHPRAISNVGLSSHTTFQYVRSQGALRKAHLFMRSWKPWFHRPDCGEQKPDRLSQIKGRKCPPSQSHVLSPAARFDSVPAILLQTGSAVSPRTPKTTGSVGPKAQVHSEEPVGRASRVCAFSSPQKPLG